MECEEFLKDVGIENFVKSLCVNEVKNIFV
jgi:hypothetical protein